MKGRLVVVGDALLDRDVVGRVDRLCPEAPVPVLDEVDRRARPGGAGLAAALAAADGRRVALVTALAGDRAGRELGALLDAADVEVIDLGLEGATPTKVRFRCDGHLLLRLDGGTDAGRPGRATAAAREALAHAEAVLVSDYGRGLAAEDSIRSALATVRAPVVWDPHPRGAVPLPRCRLVTPNQAEATRLVPELDGDGLDAVSERAQTLARRWSAAGVAVTLGAAGALLVQGEAPAVVLPTDQVDGDACGAGDRFASAAAGGLADGRWLPDAVAEAVARATAFVRDGGAGAFSVEGAPPPPAAVGAEAVVARVRAEGGTVVATGGCFDLLHAGHVATLEAARALGDCLVVCLNSDESVRRLKGSDRPLVPEEDRAAVLQALGSVDAVVVFDEDTPQAALVRLRPDIWAKGGDYALEELPEAQLVARWGGQAVVLPYVEGRSTTRLLEDIALRAH